jgi:hypothetical protein
MTLKEVIVIIESARQVARHDDAEGSEREERVYLHVLNLLRQVKDQAHE